METSGVESKFSKSFASLITLSRFSLFQPLIEWSIVVPNKKITEEPVLIYVVDWELSYMGSIEWDLGNLSEIIPTLS